MGSPSCSAADQPSRTTSSLGGCIRATLDKIDFTPNTDVISKALEAGGGGYADAVSTRMSTLTKGRAIGGDAEAQAEAAERLFRSAIKTGMSDPGKVLKSLSPQFAGALNMAINNTPQAYAMNSWVSELNRQLESALGKSITLTSPLASSLAPFDLVAPTKLIYPVYSPFRNLVPRVPGQGIAHKAKVITSISGALPGGLATPGNRISIPELPAGGGIAGTNWPNQLPAAGSQTAIDVSVPYRFFGLTEAVSWLAQFASQGFDDAAGLASLILLQEMMLLEERAMIAATSIALSTPTAPGATARTAGTGETALTGVTTNIYVRTTTVNYYGETVSSTSTSVAVSAGQVVDVTIPANLGGLATNIYVGTGTADPGVSGSHLMASAVGGYRYTLQGALPTGTATPPTADTGTAAATDYEGFIPTITGHSATGGSAIYPSGYQGSYVNQQVGDVLSANVLNTALAAMFDGSSGIFADPDDLWAEGGDLTRLAINLSNNTSATQNFRYYVQQSEMDGMRGGVAVSEFVNPITRKVINLRVHPYLPQGNALLMSWKLPMPMSNVSNVWENVMVQDYLSISWPVVDVTFRYSLFMMGALFTPAVQYNGYLGGLQKSASTPYS